jgi:hypothetical protein
MPYAWRAAAAATSRRYDQRSLSAHHLTLIRSVLIAALVVVGSAGATSEADVVGSDPTAASAWTGPITITQGGTYSGSWESTSPSTPAVTIATSAPVTITGRVRNLFGGPLIDALPGGAVQVTVEHVSAYGGGSYQTSGRFFQAYDFKSVTIRNSTIENTRGIELTYGVAGSSVLVTRNKHRNIQGNGISPVGNFVQLRVVQDASIEVSWNEIVNEYGKSNPEDIISLYHTSNARVHDNMLWHQSTPGNARNTSSQGGITLDSSGTGPGCHRNRIARNQVVDGMGIVTHVTHGGDDNLLSHNRIVNDGRLPNGWQNGNGWLAMRVVPGGANNHAHGNVIGFVNRYGARNDAAFDGTPEGDAGEWKQNLRLRGPITRASEQREWTIWKRKLAAKKIRIGR